MSANEVPDSLQGQARVEAIRSRMIVLDPAFLDRYPDWLVRFEKQDIGDEDVPGILEAIGTELSRLDAAYRDGRINGPSLAIARDQVGHLAHQLLGQDHVSSERKRHLREYIEDTFSRRFLESEGRFTHDWFYFHESQWRKHFGHLAGEVGLRVLEIGSFEGRSTTWFLREILTGEGSHIVCVDHFDAYEGHEANFDHNIRATGQAHRVLKLRGLSQQVMRFLEPAAYDFVYVDGDHRNLEVVQDAALAWKLLKPGGIAVFDDYEAASLPGTVSHPAKLAVDAFLSLVPGGYEVLFQDWQVAVRKTG